MTSIAKSNIISGIKFNTAIRPSIPTQFARKAELKIDKPSDDYVPLEERAELTESETIALNMVREYKQRKQDANMVNQTFLNKFIEGGDIPYKELSNANIKLKLKYQVDNPIQLALEAVKPVIQYRKSGHKKNHIPVVLPERNQACIVGRWLIDHVYSKTKGQGSKLNYNTALLQEFDSILCGTSALYGKRYQMHKAP